MYTRCPDCQTAYRITIAQLKARDGLVRCGRCDSVFRADLHLFAPPAGTPPVEAPRERAEEQETLRLRDKEIPIITDTSIFQAPQRGLPAPIWVLGALALAALLVGQFAYFYRDELAQVPALRPPLARFCAHLGCELAPLVGAAVPELVETRIAPHPRYSNVLRLRARLVNRSEREQPLPLLQVSLTDSEGRLLARRTFAPHHYVQPPARPDAPMPPNIVVDALLDVTNPDEKAAGFEIQLFAAAG